MMSDPETPIINQTERPQDEYEVAKQDVMGLIGLVGQTLVNVDQMNVGGSKRAVQLSDEKIFKQKQAQQLKQPTIDGPPQPAVPQPVDHPPPVQKQEEIKVASNISVNDFNKIMQQIESVEKKVDNLTKTYNNILTKLTKNTKRVTLTINND